MLVFLSRDKLAVAIAANIPHHASGYCSNLLNLAGNHYLYPCDVCTWGDGFAIGSNGSLIIIQLWMLTPESLFYYQSIKDN